MNPSMATRGPGYVGRRDIFRTRHDQRRSSVTNLKEEYELGPQLGGKKFTDLVYAKILIAERDQKLRRRLDELQRLHLHVF